MRLADCFIDVLAYAKLYLRRPGPDYDAFRARVLKLLQEAKERSEAAGYSSADHQSALFAVAAWSGGSACTGRQRGSHFAATVITDARK